METCRPSQHNPPARQLVALIPVAMSRSTGSITREEAAAAAGVPLLHLGCDTGSKAILRHVL
jgi:hypothetical protein